MPPLRTLRISHRSRSSLSCIRSPAFQLVDQFRIFKVSNQLLKTTCMRQTEYERQAKNSDVRTFSDLFISWSSGRESLCDNAHGRLSEDFLLRQTTKHDNPGQAVDGGWLMVDGLPHFVSSLQYGKESVGGGVWQRNKKVPYIPFRKSLLTSAATMK